MGITQSLVLQQGQEVDDRLIQLVIYYITYGIIIEIAICIARYKRADETHDEVHAGLMMSSFAICMGIDIWYVVAVSETLFDDWIKCGNFILICMINVLVFIQGYFGATTRVRMHSLIRTHNYYRLRRTHKFTGYLIYVLTKVRLVFLSMKDSDKVGVGLLAVIITYLVLLVTGRVILEIVIRKAGNKWRNKNIIYAPKEFDADQKRSHRFLFEFMQIAGSSKYLKKLFPDIRWVFIEDKIFDVNSLDHPGGRFMWNAINAREISRYFFGAQSYEFLDCGSVKHKHTPFSNNLLDKRFIGLADDPCV